MKEIWKEIENSNGAYEISSFGRIRSFYKRVALLSFIDKNIIPKILSPVKWNSGYLSIILRINGKSIGRSIHRLVAVAFLGKPSSSYLQVSHNDGNRLNNRMDNLSWLSAKENHSLKKEHGTLMHGDNHYRSKLSFKKVSKIRELFKKGDSVKSLSEKFDVRTGNIYKVINNKSWKGCA